MLSKEDYFMIQEQISRGVYRKDIAVQLGVHPRTVSRAVDRGGAPKPTRVRGCKLDPYKAAIDQLLVDNVWNAQVIWRVIQGQGYDGGISIIKGYIQPKRPLRPSKATVRFETAPGKQLQSDWGEIFTEIAGQVQKVRFTVHTLGYSRRFHFWGTDREDAEHTYEGLIRALEWLGGATGQVLIDNLKSCVITHRIGERVVFNKRFLDLADHYGFVPRACRPARAQTKGKDERMVRYIKENFFVRYRRFESFAHLNQLAEQWLREVADPRLHGTVKEVVSLRFLREQPHLLSLPPVRLDTSYREHRLVAWDGYLDVRGNRYSVPTSLCGKTVQVHITLDDRLRVLSDDALIVEHCLQPAALGWLTVPDHHRRLWEQILNVERRDLKVYEEVAQCN